MPISNEFGSRYLFFIQLNAGPSQKKGMLATGALILAIGGWKLVMISKTITFRLLPEGLSRYPQNEKVDIFLVWWLLIVDNEKNRKRKNLVATSSHCIDFCHLLSSFFFWKSCRQLKGLGFCSFGNVQIFLDFVVFSRIREDEVKKHVFAHLWRDDCNKSYYCFFRNGIIRNTSTSKMKIRLWKWNTFE